MSSNFETMPYGQDAAASAQSRQELQAKLNGLGGLNGRKLSPEAKEKKLREACEGFESIFIQKMWQEMRNTVPKGGLLQSREEHFWQDMYDQELSKSMTKAGGIGLADMMYEQLSRNLVDASRSAAGMAMGGAFTPSAAPLVSAPQEEAAVESAPASQAQASIYEGEAPAADAAMAESGEDDDAAMLMARTAMANLRSAETMAAQSSARAPKAESSGEKAVKIQGADENSGLHLSYMAKRDAGDKLGSRAVRPSMRPRKQSRKEEAPEAQTQNIASLSQANQPAHGSAEGIKEAIEKAKSGGVQLTGESGASLHNIVAAVQARNAMSAAGAVQTQTPAAAGAAQAADLTLGAQAVSETAQAASTEPVSRKVRYTTNIPQKGKSGKAPKKNDVIRMLNVDNVGVNSKQGQGLAAYHAAQEAARAQTRPAAQNESAAQAPISPLTAQSLEKDKASENAGYAIPPLTAGNV